MNEPKLFPASHLMPTATPNSLSNEHGGRIIAPFSSSNEHILLLITRLPSLNEHILF